MTHSPKVHQSFHERPETSILGAKSTVIDFPYPVPEGLPKAVKTAENYSMSYHLKYKDKEAKPTFYSKDRPLWEEAWLIFKTCLPPDLTFDVALFEAFFQEALASGQLEPFSPPISLNVLGKTLIFTSIYTGLKIVNTELETYESTKPLYLATWNLLLKDAEMRVYASQRNAKED